MNARLRTLAKKTLSRILPDSTKLRYLAYLPKMEALRKNHLEEYPLFENRHEMYDHINNTAIRNEAIEYLEFGVFEGASIKYWANLNSDALSKFYGFDTFTGLPETWENFIRPTGKNAFDAKGRYPQIDDDRVSFIAGLFQETLPKFLESFRSERQLIIHNDADLYSSTLYVLTCANRIIVPGTIIIFDEFSSMLNEFRALDDYCASYSRSYDIVGATVSNTDYFTQIAIRMK